MSFVLWMGTETDCNLGKTRPQTSSSLGVWVCICVLLMPCRALPQKQYISNAKSVKTDLFLKVKCFFFSSSSDLERDK